MTYQCRIKLVSHLDHGKITMGEMSERLSQKTYEHRFTAPGKKTKIFSLEELSPGLDKGVELISLEIDGFHETGYELGNYLTAAHLGAMIRIGKNLPVEFSDPRLTLAAHTQKLYSDESTNDENWSLYAILGARVTGVFHDITLDGPVFRNFDTGVKKERLVGEVYAGFGVRRGGWEFGYVHTYSSKEFETQNDPQAFGSVAIRKRF